MAKDLKQLLAEGLITRGRNTSPHAPPHTPSPSPAPQPSPEGELHHSSTHVVHRCGYLAHFFTGITEIDRTLPGNGLKRGAIHEWFGWGLQSHGPTGGIFPPISILTALALRSSGLLIWIGRHIWPSPLVLPPAALGRSLFIDPPEDKGSGPRLWAIDQALRCPDVAEGIVVADGSGLDMAASRRLQFAAESGRGTGEGAIGLLARPPRERSIISAAETRWQVIPHLPAIRHLPSGALAHPRWRLQLLRCKGAPMDESHTWIVELAPGAQGEGHASALRACADVADQPAPAPPAEIPRITA